MNDQNFYWGAGVVEREGVTVKMLEVGWWGWEVIKESFQNHPKVGGG